ncbi:hypothetical protein [Paenibacillus xylanexedens]|nr:hypothetical protein [Paenibacillus xylanexedens]
MNQHESDSTLGSAAERQAVELDRWEFDAKHRLVRGYSTTLLIARTT